MRGVSQLYSIFLETPSLQLSTFTGSWEVEVLQVLVAEEVSRVSNSIIHHIYMRNALRTDTAPPNGRADGEKERRYHGDHVVHVTWYRGLSVQF